MESIHDELRILRALDALRSVETPADLIGWSEGPLHAVLPHDVALFSSGVLREGRRRLREDIHRNFPVEYLDHFRQTDGLCLTPTMKRVFQTRRAQVFEPGMDPRFTTAQLETFRRFGLRNIVAHGWIEETTGFTTYVSLNRLHASPGPRHTRVLELLTPQISVTLARVQCNERRSTAAVPGAGHGAAPRLTPKELEIVRLLPAGHTNYAIAVILGRQEKTVKKQLEHIYRKLDVVTRVQAAHWWTTVGRSSFETASPSAADH